MDVIAALAAYGISITIYDLWANPAEVQRKYALETTTELPNQKLYAVVLEVAHKEFLKLDLTSLQNANSVLYDVKGILGNTADGRL